MLNPAKKMKFTVILFIVRLSNSLQNISFLRPIAIFSLLIFVYSDTSLLATFRALSKLWSRFPSRLVLFFFHPSSFLIFLPKSLPISLRGSFSSFRFFKLKKKTRYNLRAYRHPIYIDNTYTVTGTQADVKVKRYVNFPFFSPPSSVSPAFLEPPTKSFRIPLSTLNPFYPPVIDLTTYTY